MSPAEFRALGHDLVDRIADFLGSLRSRPVTTGESPTRIRELLGDPSLPESGAAPADLLREASNLLFDHSLFNGHPRFLGYITSSAAPIGALGEMLAAAVNPNVGAWILSPVASEIERRTVAWIAEMLGYPPSCGGVLVSGGNMANMVGFFAARRARAGWDIRTLGARAAEGRALRLYASQETHVWVQKAADLSGMGTEAIRWIPADADQRMDVNALRRAIEGDLRSGDAPFLVVGTAGSVSTGVVDPLDRIHEVCREHSLWFHVDGAYGALAVLDPASKPLFSGMEKADSIAVDPHKWLYAPLEAGCALVREPQALRDAFSFSPPYYRMDEVAGEPVLNYVEQGPQNSRGFRALKVWLALRQVGRSGYARMIGDDIALAQRLYERVAAHPELEAKARNLSMTAFRYVPESHRKGDAGSKEYLDRLNEEILARLEAGGEAFVSKAPIESAIYMRSCIVNFRTSAEDIDAIPEIVVRLGREAHARLAKS
jgi:aromatic-L-amino-acid decarboxylase